MKIFLAFLFIACTSFADAQTRRGNDLALSQPISFVGNSAVLTPGSDVGLKEIKAWLDAKTYITTLRIEGHVSGLENNEALSEQRALAVCTWLVAHGVDCKRLIAVGFGDTKPAGEGMNTRIVAANAALRGHDIGGMPADGGGKPAGEVCK